MAYCTKDQVASEAKIAVSFSGATTPTSTKVDEIIAEVDAEIDAKVGRKYTLPIVGAATALILRAISIALVTERVREIMEVKTGSDKLDQNPAASTARDARKRLDAIAEGTFPLAQEVLASSSDGVRSYAVSNDLCPVMKKGVEQW